MSGDLLHDSANDMVNIAPDGQGGSVAVALEAGSTGRSLQWIDAAGNTVRSAPLDNDVAVVMVNWATRHVFAFVGGTSSRPPQGRWYDAAGAPLTPWFSLNTSKGAGASMHVLVDGTIVITSALSSWDVAVADANAGPVPAPAWLTSRPNTRIATIRGGRGYAILPMNGGDKLEVVSASGQSCGTVVLPALSPAEAGSSPPRLDVGQDGTLFETASGSDGGRCDFRWWPALLR